FEGEGEERKFREKITNDVYIGDLPLITQNGTFIINGAERVIVSQLHRSPGVSFDEETHPNGKRLLKARVIPYRGSWVEFLIDVNEAMYINIDRRRKIPATILLRAIGFSKNQDLVKLFYEADEVAVSKDTSSLEDKVLYEDLVDRDTGELIAEANTVISASIAKKIGDMQMKKVKLVKGVEGNPVFHNTLSADPTSNEEEALFRIYSLIRPGDPPNVQTAKTLLERLFFDDKRYDLGEVGRYRLNSRLKLKVPMDTMTMTKEDFIAIMRYLVSLYLQEGVLDDIDHLGNRRVRSVGELLGNQFSLGLTRMARTIRERLSLRDTEELTPQDLVNARTVSTVISTFFGSSQLSQFMDQMNPLAELTHKRRMSALGPGGLTRERAGFEVRDVHHSHYGRLCPIETPEGPNIGLISSLAAYAKVNQFGFIETPYRKVKAGVVSDEVVYLTADQEDDYYVAPASTQLDPKNKFANEFVIARKQGEFPLVPRDQVQLMDVSPKQLVSIAAGLIPFLEHDDANRALMGSNMQRQAVPLLVTDSPLVGTGLEGKAAYDSGAMVVAQNAGVIHHVDARTIIVKR
ncbi:MAG TPA: DNA-directed RNA polymerase subunit beta, partial [Fibrobacteria bacterium]|nr:DNA-directed RNA polymerase subunit beta [Fibrobacteria bacterium]